MIFRSFDPAENEAKRLTKLKLVYITSIIFGLSASLSCLIVAWFSVDPYWRSLLITFGVSVIVFVCFEAILIDKVSTNMLWAASIIGMTLLIASWSWTHNYWEPLFVNLGVGLLLFVSLGIITKTKLETMYHEISELSQQIDNIRKTFGYERGQFLSQEFIEQWAKDHEIGIYSDDFNPSLGLTPLEDQLREDWNMGSEKRGSNE